MLHYIAPVKSVHIYSLESLQRDVFNLGMIVELQGKQDRIDRFHAQDKIYDIVIQRQKMKRHLRNNSMYPWSTAPLPRLNYLTVFFVKKCPKSLSLEFYILHTQQSADETPEFEMFSQTLYMGICM